MYAATTFRLRAALTLVPTLALPLAGVASQPSATPAERRMVEARATLEESPSAVQAQVDLAMALARRARETSDPSFYAQGLESVTRALDLAPGSVEALKARAWILLGQHRFAEAREEAVSLNKRVPDDVMVYGLLTDANAELGRYDEAEKACQWMLNLRPGNVPALTRAAYLRETFGDLEGALELMNMALESTALDEVEDRAWILTQVGHLELSRGRVAVAEAAVGEALLAFPGYHYALGQMARIREAQGRQEEAARLETERHRGAPHPENLFSLAQTLERAGHGAGARRAFERFEREARQEMDSPDNANRELIFYYADHANRPEEAERLAMREAKTRRDIHTLDALAWAHYRRKRWAEAKRAIEEALEVGTVDPRILSHAVEIARSAGDQRAAAAYRRRRAEASHASESLRATRAGERVSGR